MNLPTERQWGQYSALCARLQPLPTAARAAALQELRVAGAADPQVLSLVAVHFALPPDPDRLRPGERVGSCTVEEPLGAGGMGVVYRAQQHLGPARRPVSVKLIHPALLRTAREEAFTQFLGELHTLVTLQHDSIARIYDGGLYENPHTHDQLPYLVMELVRDGLSLTTYARDYALTWRERLALMLRVCRAIQYAHEHRVVHRDLKPANILVDPDGRPVVIDFGLACTADALLPGAHLAAAGTPAYMSPEQVSDAFGPISAKSDVYALGLLLYELLTEQRPYVLPRDGAVEDLCQVITATRPPPLRQHDPAYGGELDALVAAALAKQPAERPTVAVLRSRLARYLQQLPPASDPPRQPMALPDLNHRIMAVRKAIGDNGRAQRCIKTLHGRGYRCIAAVVAEGSSLTSSAAWAAFSAPAEFSMARDPAESGSMCPPPHLVGREVDLPSGTVTLLFTDIEDSTSLIYRLGDHYAAVLEAHRRLVLTAVEQHDGCEVDSKDDSFFIVFGRAADAVAAAIEIQRALAAQASLSEAGVRLRMGLHTGELRSTSAGYVGLDVHRAARLCAAGHGGQVLLSDATRVLVEPTLQPGVGLRDLGEYRLKDIQRPERVFQLVIDSLPDKFPPLRTLDARPHNLPVQTTTLIGREREVAEITCLLLRDDVRLLTLTGPGGIGKTRLAVEVARRLAEERQLAVAFTELAPIADPALVPHAIAGAVGVRERVDRPLLETLAEVLRPARLVLVLDNCEHLVAGCGSIAQALRRACPDLRILATSRAPLEVSGEVTWSVPLLAVSPDETRRSAAPALAEAVQLFVDRARLTLPGFGLTDENAEGVTEICRRLEGLPLAIELAAARIRLLPPDALLARLDRRLQLLVGGPRDLPRRQQTLQDAIAWSYDLLNDSEQMVFRRLGLFAGGFSLEAAETVCTADVDDGRRKLGGTDTATVLASASHAPSPNLLDILGSLLAKNLLRQERTAGEPRFTMLETIREYARQQLETCRELAAVRDRCAVFFLALAEEAAQKLVGRDQRAWLQRLDTELDHLRAVFGWSRAGEIDAAIGLRLAGALVMYWEFRGFAIEGHDWVTAMLALPGASARTVARARALYAAAFIVAMQGDFAAQRALAQESTAIFQEAGHLQEAGRSLAEQAVGEARLGNVAVARVLLVKSVEIAREHGDQWGLTFALGQLGVIAYHDADFTAARRFREEAASVARTLGDRHTLGLALAGLALVARAQEHYDESEQLFHEALLVSSELKDQWVMPRALGGLAGAAVLAANYERAARLFGATAAMRDVSGTGEAARAFRVAYEGDEARARATLGEAAFAAAWAAGRAMSLEQAVAFALGEPAAL